MWLLREQPGRLDQQRTSFLLTPDECRNRGAQVDVSPSPPLRQQKKVPFKEERLPDGVQRFLS